MARSHAHSAAFREVLRSFALFAVPIRVVIVQRLARRPRAAAELAQELPVSRVAVGQHLKRLEAAGRQGRRRVYRLEPEDLEPLSLWLRSLHASGEADLSGSLKRSWSVSGNR